MTTLMTTRMTPWMTTWLVASLQLGGLSADAISDKIIGPEGSKVCLTVQRRRESAGSGDHAATAGPGGGPGPVAEGAAEGEGCGPAGPDGGGPFQVVLERRCILSETAAGQEFQEYLY